MNILILDDNLEAGQNLKNEINKIFPNYTIKCYNNINEFLLAVKNIGSCIIFLDIFMPNVSGIDVSNHIYEYNRNIPVIFYSGKPRETFDVYEGNHVYFLEKPFIPSKIAKAIEIATNVVKKNVFEFHFARIKNLIPYDEICYFESSGRQIRVVTTTKTHLYFEKLDDVEKRISYSFIRLNKSFLVNPDYISQISDNKIILKEIPNIDSVLEINISKFYKKKVLEHEFFNKIN